MTIEDTEFDQFADGYSDTLDGSVAWSGGGAAAFAEHKASLVARTIQPKSVLDYGCGVGLLARELVRLIPECRVDGFDISAQSIERVPENLREQGTFTTDMNDLQSDYDLVVVSNVLHHVPKHERADFVAAGVSKLTSGGRFAIFEHNPLNPLTRWIVSTCEFDEDAVLLWPSESRSLLVSAGLSVERRESILFFPPFLSSLWQWEHHLAWLPIGAQYLYVGSKR